jgi:hypothetical protein
VQRLRKRLFADDHEFVLDVSSSKLYDAVICITQAVPGPPREGWPGMVGELKARVGGFGPERTASNHGVDLASEDACRRASSRDPPAVDERRLRQD